MKLSLSRVYYYEDGVFSNLHAEDSTLVCVTLEHAYPNGDPTFPYAWAPKVPPGTYRCARGTHQLLHGDPFETFEVTGVAGHSGILFHRGNWNEDSEGCLLVGDYLSSAPNPKEGGKVCDLVTNTPAAFARFMRLMEGVDYFDLEVLL